MTEHILQIKYKESFTKNKDKAVGMNVSDSKTLHCLQVAKLNSEVKIFLPTQGIKKVYMSMYCEKKEMLYFHMTLDCL